MHRFTVIALAISFVAACASTTSNAPPTAEPVPAIEEEPAAATEAEPVEEDSYYMYLRRPGEPELLRELIDSYESEEECETVASNLKDSGVFIAVGFENPKKVDMAKFYLQCAPEKDRAGFELDGYWTCGWPEDNLLWCRYTGDRVSATKRCWNCEENPWGWGDY